MLLPHPGSQVQHSHLWDSSFTCSEWKSIFPGLLSGPSSAPSAAPSGVTAHPDPTPLPSRLPQPASLLSICMGCHTPQHTQLPQTDTSLVSTSPLPHMPSCHIIAHLTILQAKGTTRCNGPFLSTHPKVSPLTTVLRDSPIFPLSSMVTAASLKPSF